MLTTTLSFIVSACLRSRQKYIMCDFLLIVRFSLYFDDLFVPFDQNCGFILGGNHWDAVEFIILWNYNLKRILFAVIGTFVPWEAPLIFFFFQFFSLTSLVFVQIVNNRIFLMISPPFGNWTVNVEVSNWQSLPKLSLSIGWAQQREVFAFAIWSLSEYQLVSAPQFSNYALYCLTKG